jgi:hypothetical protein
MKKLVNIFLLVALSPLPTNVMVAVPVKHLATLKSSFSHGLHHYIKCLQGDNNCTRQEVILYRTATAVGAALLGTTAIYGGIQYRKNRILQTPKQSERVPIPSAEFKEKEGNSAHIKKEAAPAQQKKLNEELEQAVGDGDIKRIEQLLQNGAQVNAPLDMINSTSFFSAHTPKTAEILLNFGANINQANDLGTTPLMFRVKQIEARMVKWCIAHGADVNAVDNNGKDALAWAEENKTKVMRGEYGIGEDAAFIHAKINNIIEMLKEAKQQK